MIFARYFIEFIAFSLLGWIYETIFCTCTRGQFENRGFLFGPICPIYGFGGLAIVVLNEHVSFFMSDTHLPLWQCFLLFAFGSAVLEYVTSYVMEKLFHARWWDYSNMPLNLHGRICLPASVLFGIMGVLAMLYISPFLTRIQGQVHPLLMEGLSLIVMGFFGADVSLSYAAASHLIGTLKKMEAAFNEKMENGVQTVSAMPQKISETASSVSEAISQTADSMKETIMRSPEQMLASLSEMTRAQRSQMRSIVRFERKEQQDTVEKIRDLLKERKNRK